MAFVHGKNAAIWLDAVDVSQFFNDLSASVSVDTAETSTFGASWKTSIEGLAHGEVNCKGFYDKVNDAQLIAMIENGGSVLTTMPGGVAIGSAARLAKVHEVTVLESSPVGGAVLLTWAVQADGTIGFGYILHPAATTDSGTTTGASHDDAASSSTGWHAHLHVVAVSSGSWVVKLQDSADNSSWSDVTGAAFTAATGATSQRLASAAVTTTLRRYVRYVATVTGGSTPTITFGLAISRN